MKQAVNKAESAKASPDTVLTNTVATKQKPHTKSTTEISRLLKLKETNLFNRFLEASCDCV